MRRTIGLLVATAIISVLMSTTAAASYYYFYGYDAQTQVHSLSVAKPDGTEHPDPLRWWPPVGYTTVNTWYKLGDSLNAPYNFKTPCRSAESSWDALWGGGTKMFWFWEDTSPITDSTNRAIGMTILGTGVLGEVFWIGTTSWHPWQFSARVNRNVHTLTQWYMRFQSDMTNVPTGRQTAPLYYDWNDGDAPWVADRQSVATHEFGHVIPLMHPNQQRADIQTMWTPMDPGTHDRTGTYARSPNVDDDFALKKLYPTNLQ